MLAGVGRSPLSNEVLSGAVFFGLAGSYWLYSFSEKRHVLLERVWIALFNLSGRRRAVSVSAASAGLSSFCGQELWTGKTVRNAGVLRAVLSPHDAAVFSLKMKGR